MAKSAARTVVSQRLREQEAELRQQLHGDYAKGSLRDMDLAWLKLFRDNNYMEQIERVGYFSITPNEIKDGSGIEPRLMCKHDNSAQQPVIFRQEGLSILPMSRTEYMVGKFSTFHKFPDLKDAPMKFIDVPRGIESLDFMNLTSEAVALNAASIVGIIEDFIGETDLKATVSGRMSTTDMQIDVALPSGKTYFDVNTQMEIDAGYESDESVVLVEAKNKLPEDFNIRQIYYPFRRFKQQVKKNVRNIYLTYSNGVFTLYEFIFDDERDFQSIRKGNCQRYMLRSSHVSKAELQEIALKAQASLVQSAEPFPQADTFQRVISLAEEIYESPDLCIEIDTIAASQGFVSRQKDYYRAAGRYIGLFDESEGNLFLSEAGMRVMQSGSLAGRNLALAELMLRDPVINAAFGMVVNKEPSPKTQIAKLILDGPKKYSQSTAERRAATVLHWVNWVLQLADE